MIPKDWEIKRIKNVTCKVGSGKTPKGGSEVYADEGIMFLRSQNIHNDGIRKEDVVYIDLKTDREMSNTRVKEQDILLNITGASIGRCAFYSEANTKANVNQHVCIIRLAKDIENKEFYLYTMQSSYIQNQIMAYQTGTSREGLNFEQIRNFVFTHPLATEEKREILKFLKVEIQILTNILKTVEIQLEKIKHARQSLISEAVTGKIDLKEWEITEVGEAK